MSELVIPFRGEPGTLDETLKTVCDGENVEASFKLSTVGVGLPGKIAYGIANLTFSASAQDITKYFTTVDSTGGNTTVNLPASPEDGDTYVVTKSVASNNVVVEGNGKNINGASSETLVSLDTTWVFTYNGTEWRAY